MGRFSSPDPSRLTYADITNPQSLNLYSYALNNPLKFIDPTSMYCFYGGKGDTVENDSDPSDYDFTSEGTGECSSTGGQWIDNPSTTVTVSAGGDNGNTLSTFPSDISQNYQFIPGHGCSAALKTALLVVVLLSLNGCMMVKSESDVLGRYELKVGADTISLKVSSDKSFTEEIAWQGGKVQNHSGKWLWANEGISFDQLWIPREFAPQYIIQADASASENKQPKYTEPGHWFIRPERHWGRVILPVFPDADTEFKMVSHASQ